MHAKPEMRSFFERALRKGGMRHQGTAVVAAPIVAPINFYF
jgi:hypothetical protein